MSVLTQFYGGGGAGGGVGPADQPPQLDIAGGLLTITGTYSFLTGSGTAEWLGSMNVRNLVDTNNGAAIGSLITSMSVTGDGTADVVLYNTLFGTFASTGANPFTLTTNGINSWTGYDAYVVNGSAGITDDGSLTSVEKVRVTGVGIIPATYINLTFSITSATNLQTVEIIDLIWRNGSGQAGVNNARLFMSVKDARLSAQTVNDLLVLAANRLSSVVVGAITSGTGQIDLSGGTSAGTSALTAAGIAARNTLTTAPLNVSVILNP